MPPSVRSTIIFRGHDQYDGHFPGAKLKSRQDAARTTTGITTFNTDLHQITRELAWPPFSSGDECLADAGVGADHDDGRKGMPPALGSDFVVRQGAEPEMITGKCSEIFGSG